jgi:hypothetical protein
MSRSRPDQKKFVALPEKMGKSPHPALDSRIDAKSKNAPCTALKTAIPAGA